MILGMIVVNMFSANQHDKAIEAVITSFFVFGPALATLSVIAFLIVRFVR